MPKAVKNLNYVANFIIITLLVIAYVDYFTSIGGYNDIVENIRLISYSNERKAEMGRVLQDITKLILAS